MDENGTIYESAHWSLKHRVDSKLPGYLILVSRAQEADSLGDLPPDALRELGPIQAKAVEVLEQKLSAVLAYVCRWGHQPGRAPHFHIIPLYRWVQDAYACHPAYGHPDPDGPMYSQFIAVEFIESSDPPAIHGPSVAEVASTLRREFENFCVH